MMNILCPCLCGWLQGGWGAEGARGGVCGCPGAPPQLWGSPASSEWLLVPLPRKSLQASAIRVQVGQLRLYDHDKLTKVSKIVQHPDYNQILSAEGGADIALLRLQAPVSLSHHVQVVSLPPASLRVPEGKMCWGSVTVHCRFGET